MWTNTLRWRALDLHGYACLFAQHTHIPCLFQGFHVARLAADLRELLSQVSDSFLREWEGGWGVGVMRACVCDGRPGG